MSKFEKQFEDLDVRTAVSIGVCRSTVYALFWLRILIHVLMATIHVCSDGNIDGCPNGNTDTYPDATLTHALMATLMYVLMLTLMYVLVATLIHVLMATEMHVLMATLIHTLMPFLDDGPVDGGGHDTVSAHRPGGGPHHAGGGGKRAGGHRPAEGTARTLRLCGLHLQNH